MKLRYCISFLKVRVWQSIKLTTIGETSQLTRADMQLDATGTIFSLTLILSIILEALGENYRTNTWKIRNNKKPVLDSRLTRVLTFVSSSKFVADIGGDHGLLGKFLCLKT